jgi:hypothetical protein
MFMINGALKLGPALPNIILCEASRLKINSRDKFVRRCAELLKSAPSPVSRNDGIQTVRVTLRDTAHEDILISHSTSTSEEEFDDCEYRRRY